MNRSGPSFHQITHHAPKLLIGGITLRMLLNDFHAAGDPLVRLPDVCSSSLLAIVLEPTDNLIIIDEPVGAKRFVVVEVCHTIHDYCLADNRTIHVPIRAATIDGYVGIRRVKGG